MLPTKTGFTEIGNVKIIRELFRFRAFMEEIGKEFFLVGGTCLGAVRDGCLFPHDKDIDVGVMGEEVLYEIMKIEKEKYKYYDEVHVVGEAHHDKILWLKKYFPGGYVLPIEVGAHCTKGDYIYYNRKMGSSWHCEETRIIWNKRESFKSLKRHHFAGVDFLIPHPIEKFLEAFYGSDWRTPKKYVDWRYNCNNLYDGYFE